MIVTTEEYKMIEYALRSVERECEKEIRECAEHQTQFAEHLTKKKNDHMRLRLKIRDIVVEQYTDDSKNDYKI